MQPFKAWLFSDLIEKNKRVFKVPVYQRNYDWSNIQCEKLFRDIMIANERDHKHFTGTIVYIVGIDGSNLNEVLVIDGQQRITTMYILLKALYDSAKGVSVRIESEIEEVMFNRNCDEKYKLKLKPVKSDNEQLSLLMKDQIEEMDRNSNIYKNYIIFMNLIEETLNSNLELNDILNGIKKLELVEIVLDKTQGDEPQKIFESINSTGLELSLADLIRNYLLMDDVNQDELYEDYWCEIEKNVGYRNLGDFVLNFLNSNISKSVNSKNAYRLFKEYCEENDFSHLDILEKLKQTSKYYGAFIGENSYYSEKISGYLIDLESIKQTTVLPFIFRIFNDYEFDNIDECILCNILDYLLTYLVRITACEMSKNLAKFMKSLYSRAFNDNYDNYYEQFVIFLNDLKANNRMPSNQEFQDALIYKPLYKKPICKFLLAIIENSTKEQIDVDNMSIEHILPQKENAVVWKKEVGLDYNRVFETYLHTLGNLTISGHNSELGTKSFKEKKEIIISYSKANILNKEVLSVDKWTESAIINRATNLSNIIIDKFKYIEMTDTNIKSSELDYSLDSDIDFSNTKPSAFNFIGEYTKVSSWIDLLDKFINISYDLDPDLLVDVATNQYIISDKTNIYISNDERKIRKPRQIGKSGIFFETNLSAHNIITVIKSLLITIDLSIDDFSFSLSKPPFDISDENTWSEIPVAKLFYNLIEDLIIKSKITSNEIERLKIKENTKLLFKRTNYPAFADKRDDNRGNSENLRYRSKPLKFNNQEIYISNQFYEEDRDNVIKWYKLLLNRVDNT